MLMPSGGLAPGAQLDVHELTREQTHLCEHTANIVPAKALQSHDAMLEIGSLCWSQDSIGAIMALTADITALEYAPSPPPFSRLVQS